VLGAQTEWFSARCRGAGEPVWGVIVMQVCLPGLMLGAALLLQAAPRPVTAYTGMCDASAAAALDTNLFVVGSDEDSRLRMYHADRGGPPVSEVDLTRFLEVDAHSPETDIEAATRVGDRIYWLTSHGRNVRGKFRESRDRLFATKVVPRDGVPGLVPEGKPYKELLFDLVTAPTLARYELAAAAGKAPKASDALNLEGICGMPGGRLLIGFRNPVPHGRALLVPLLNPTAVIGGTRARLGEPIELDLGGLGVRDLAFVDGRYLIVGGPAGSGGRSHLFLWEGPGTKPRRQPHTQFRGINPEAIIVYPQFGYRRVQLLSDDGTRLVDGCPCKLLHDPQRQSFRSVWVEPVAP